MGPGGTFEVAQPPVPGAWRALAAGSAGALVPGALAVAGFEASEPVPGYLFAVLTSVWIVMVIWLRVTTRGRRRLPYFRIDGSGATVPLAPARHAGNLIPWPDIEGMVVITVNRRRMLGVVTTPRYRDSHRLGAGITGRLLGFPVDRTVAAGTWGPDTLAEVASVLERHAPDRYLIDLTTEPATTYRQGPAGPPAALRRRA